jgi:hypothetical protein
MTFRSFRAMFEGDPPHHDVHDAGREAEQFQVAPE